VAPRENWPGSERGKVTILHAMRNEDSITNNAFICGEPQTTLCPSEPKWCITKSTQDENHPNKTKRTSLSKLSSISLHSDGIVTTDRHGVTRQAMSHIIISSPVSIDLLLLHLADMATHQLAITPLRQSH